MKLFTIIILLLASSCVQKPKKSFKEGSGDHLEPLREQYVDTNTTDQNVFVNNKKDRVTICHQTGNGNSHEITVAESAVPAHLDHGDSRGACNTIVIPPTPTPPPVVIVVPTPSPEPPPVVIVDPVPTPEPPPVVIVEPDPTPPPVVVPVIEKEPFPVRKANFCSIHRTLGPYISHDPWIYTYVAGVTSQKVFTTTNEITFGFTLSNGTFFIPKQNSFLNYIYIGNTYGSFDMNQLVEESFPRGVTVRSIFYSFHTESEIRNYGHNVFANSFLNDTLWSSKFEQNESWNRSSVDILFSRLRDTYDPRCDMTYSPLLLDLAGNGIKLSSPQDGMSFDINGDGHEEQISCPLSDKTPFLVLPKNGQVEDVNQLFGNNTVGPDKNTAPNGFMALAKYDLNLDGFINQEDEVFGKLRLWSNSNCDNRSEQSELRTLADAGIYEINLLYKDIYQSDEYTNISKQLSNASSDDGDIKVFDVWFADGSALE